MLSANRESSTWHSFSGFMLGVALPTYLLDDGTQSKLWAGILIGLLFLNFIISSGLRIPNFRSSLVELGVASFIVIYFFVLTIDLTAGGREVGINYFYAAFLGALAFVRKRLPYGLFVGLFLSTLCIVTFGWYRFITGGGGDDIEHALGYWGIKYTSATRNNDVIAPLLLVMLATYGYDATVAKRRIVQAILVASLCLGVLAIVFSYSRGAWISLIAFLLFYVAKCIQEKNRQRIVVNSFWILIIGGSVVLFLVMQANLELGPLWERILSISDSRISSSNQNRWELIKYSVLLGLIHPLLGAGPGNFTCCTEELGFGGLAGALHPENLLAQVHAEMGLVCALILATTLIGAATRGVRSDRLENRMAGSMLIAILVWLQFNSELQSMFLWILIGILVRFTFHDKSIRRINDQKELHVT